MTIDISKGFNSGWNSSWSHISPPWGYF